jgi:PKD repeat protein
MDDQYHGTHVSGTIGGVGNNGAGVAGVAWRVKLMGLKFLDSNGSGSSSNAIKCIDYAIAKGAHILSNSWGGGGYSQALYDAINRARTAGIIFVAAAGNSNADTDAATFYPAGYRLSNVVAVASTDNKDLRSSFSNYGYATTHLGAPGSSIYSTYPNNSYNSISGTSMATPHVSGALALLKAHEPGFSMSELIARLLTSTDATTGMGAVTVTGGRLNVHKALAGLTRPIAHFTVSPTATTAGGTVTFTDSSLGNITSRTLNFGDGSPEVSLNGSTTHAYATEGSYTATLTVSGPDGTATRSRTVVVAQNYTAASDTYQWVDTTGMSTVALGDDAVSGAITLPFSFPFYGTNYSSLYISSNGFVTLGSNAGGTALSNGAIPSTGTPNAAIYAYWDDLNPADTTAPGTIRHGATGDGNFVVSWEGVPIYGQSTLPLSFQIVLAPSGLVQIQYKEVQPANTTYGAGRSATSGVEHPAGTMARQYSLNGSPLLANNSAVRFSRGNSTRPAAPSNLTAQAASGTQINLSWTDNSTDETGFRIERSSGGGGFAQVAVTGAGVTTYPNTGLTAGIAYTYRVIAVNAAGDSTASNTATATTPTPPAAPTGLTATVVSSTQINLAWTDYASDETGYRVLRSTDNATFGQIAQLPAGTTAYQSTGLQADTTYYFRVVAYNNGGPSEFAAASAKTDPPPPPPAPGNLTATAVSSSQITLNWADVATETSYRVEKSTDNATFSTVATLAANASSYTVSGLTANTTYYFRVVAINSGGEAASTASATTLSATPTAPSNLSASGVTTTAVVLTWRDNSNNESGFVLERIAGKVTVTISPGANTTSYSDTGLKAGTKYSYRVKAVAGSVSSAYSNTVTVTTLRR